METYSKGRGRPKPDAGDIKRILYELERALSLQHKFKSNLVNNDQQPDIVSLESRDSSVHILRCLKVWFDLPSIVFLTSVNVLDRFLSKMVVKQKFLACVTISCLKIAAEIHRCQINITNLVSISQSQCSVQDVERMSDIIRTKLELQTLSEPVTAYNFVNLFLRFFDCVATQLEVKPLSSRMLQKKILLRRLEVVMSNSQCATENSTVIALGLIQTEIEKFLAAEIPSKSPYYSVEMLQFLTIVIELQRICNMVPEEYTTCYENLKSVLRDYDDHSRLSFNQNLKWRFSYRTLNTPKPLENFFTNLNTITED